MGMYGRKDSKLPILTKNHPLDFLLFVRYLRIHETIPMVLLHLLSPLPNLLGNSMELYRCARRHPLPPVAVLRAKENLATQGLRSPASKKNSIMLNSRSSPG